MGEYIPDSPPIGKHLGELSGISTRAESTWETIGLAALHSPPFGKHWGEYFGEAKTCTLNPVVKELHVLRTTASARKAL